MSPARLLYAIYIKRKADDDQARLLARYTAIATWGDGKSKEK